MVGEGIYRSVVECDRILNLRFTRVGVWFKRKQLYFLDAIIRLDYESILGNGIPLSTTAVAKIIQSGFILCK